MVIVVLRLSKLLLWSQGCLNRYCGLKAAYIIIVISRLPKSLSWSQGCLNRYCGLRAS